MRRVARWGQRQLRHIRPAWEPEHWWALGLAVAGLVVLALICLDRLYLYGGDTRDYSNRLYLLSSIVQALAAILALLVTLTLVATQLAAEAYSPRVVRLRLRDPWLWGAVGLYLAAILWALLFQSWLGLLGEKSVDIAILFAAEALLYLVPFTLATLRSLDPESMARSFARTGQYEALDDMIRKATNEALLSVVEGALQLLTIGAERELLEAGDRVGVREGAAHRVGARFRSIGRHACQRKNIDALGAVQDTLGDVVAYCTQQRWRGAANILNGVAMELEDYALTWFGGGSESD